METTTTQTRPVVLITGASSGIGLALARLFARDTHDLFLIARDETKLREVAESLTKEFGIVAYYAAGDLADGQFLHTVPQLVAEKKVSVNCLVNNAGSGVFGVFAETEWSRESTSIFLNAYAPTYLAKMFLPQLTEHKGQILNVVSTAALMPGKGMAVYAATKSYLLSLSESLRLECAPLGVGVVALIPGPTRSDFQQHNGLGALPAWRFPSAETVAAYGYRALQHNKAVAIHGLRNKLSCIVWKYTPRFIVRLLA